MQEYIIYPDEVEMLKKQIQKIKEINKFWDEHVDKSAIPRILQIGIEVNQKHNNEVIQELETFTNQFPNEINQ